MSNDHPLADRRMLVTGAASGIGAATARLAAGAGARVACVARRAERITRLATEIRGEPVVGDVSTPDGARECVEAAAAALGGLDALVNNAGLYLLGRLSDADPRDWKRMFDTNVLGLLYCTQAALPHVRASDRGDILNIGSVGGRRVARSTTAVYSATKFAVQAICEGLRLELGGTGVRVTSVLPGVVATELGKSTQDATLLAEVRDRQSTIGLDPHDVAREVVHVLSQPPHITVREVVILPTEQRV